MPPLCFCLFGFSFAWLALEWYGKGTYKVRTYHTYQFVSQQPYRTALKGKLKYLVEATLTTR